LWMPGNSDVLLSCGVEGLFVWDLAQRKSIFDCTAESNENAHGEGGASASDVESMEFAYGSSILLTGGKDGNINVWNTTNGYTWLETITGHKAAILCLSWNAEAQRVASTGRDGSIKIWDTRTLNEEGLEKRADDKSIVVGLLANLDGHNGDVCTLTWTDDGQQIVSGARDNTIKVWDSITGSEIRTLPAHHGDVRRIIFINKEQYMFTASLDGTVKLWECVERKREEALLTPRLTGAEATAAQNEADDAALRALLASGDTEDAALTTEKDKLLNELSICAPDGDADCFAMEMAPRQGAAKGIMAISQSDNRIVMFDMSADITNPVAWCEINGHTSAVTETASLKFATETDVAPTRRMVLSSCLDSHVHLYDASTTNVVTSFGVNGSAHCLAVNPDSEAVRYAVIGGVDYSFSCFSLMSDPTTGQYRSTPVVNCNHHAGRINALQVSPSGKWLVSASMDMSIALWKCEKIKTHLAQGGEVAGSKVPVLRPSAVNSDHTGPVSCVAWNLDSTLLASCGQDHTVRVFSVKSSFSRVWSAGELDLSQSGGDPNGQPHSTSVSSVCWGEGPSCSQLLFSGGWDHTIKMWTAGKGRDKTPEATLCGHHGKVHSLAAVPQKDLLVSASSDLSILLWHVPAGSIICRYEGQQPEDAFTAVSTLDNLIVSGSENGMLRMWTLPPSESEGCDVVPRDGMFTRVAAPPTETAVDVGE